MAKRALITGSSGFLGSHLISYLRKYDIVATPFKREWFLSPQIEDIIKKIAPDYIFHLASAGNIHGRDDDVDIFTSNLGYTFNLLQAIKDIPIKGFINVSTSSTILPIQTTYSATKMGAEALCKAYVDQYNIPIVTMRPFSLYGSGDYERHLIPLLFRSCLYHEQMKLCELPIHDWTYVEDFVEQMVAYAQKAKQFMGETIHVGTGKATSNYWLLKEIEEITRNKANIVGTVAPRDYDTQEWRATSDLGNVVFAKTQLREGLQKVFKSFTLQ